MSKRPQRAAKTRALQKVEASSDVELEDDILEFSEMESEGKGRDSDSGGSLYGGDHTARKGEGKRVTGDTNREGRSQKRARKTTSGHDPQKHEVQTSSSSSFHKKPLNRLTRLVTGPESRAARVQVKEKKSVGNTSTRGRGLGKLKRLLDIPIEVFCNILEHLDPLDLLNWARSSRALHGLIITRSMKRVWQACLKAHNVPPLPHLVPINEVQLASMLFDNSCQACGASALNTAFHDRLLVRLCKGCLNYNTSSGSKIAKTYGKGVAKDKMIYDLLPNLGRNKYLIPDFQDIIEKYIAAHADPDERRNFITKKREVAIAIAEYSCSLTWWRNGKWSQERSENNHAQEERENSILKKITDMGYSDDEISFCRSMHYDGSRSFESILNQPRRLTDRIWKSISKELLGFMERARKGLRLQKKTTVLLPFWEKMCSTYREAHNGDWPKFNFADFRELPSVKALLDDSVPEELPDTVFSELKLQLPLILEERPNKLEAECLAIVLEGREELGLASFDSISTTTRTCENESKIESITFSPFAYAFDALKARTTDSPLYAASTTFAGSIHDCDTNKPMSFQAVMDTFFLNPRPERARNGKQLSPWKAPKFQKTFAKDAEEILQAFGFPLNVTFIHMSQSVSAWLCKPCANRLRAYTYGKSWTEWVTHYATHKSTEPDICPEDIIANAYSFQFSDAR
ncbi:hypothetical protein SCHPADRAFT_992779 [Schizopora paradoxa]|uniref:F-box domain-containing protein n=1 Tax=Schizopora paradoxa TaxID=27342 RepID=A0A0H2S5L3_9AGAM|nr:hypothetical protein SCHPADRAFT_992779 [Schizopora paradoxa]